MKLLHSRFSPLRRLLVALALGVTLLLGGALKANAQQWIVLGGPAVGPDNRTRILWWRLADDGFSLWSVNPAGAIESSPIFGPFLTGGVSEWIAVDIAVGSDNKTRMLWRRDTDQAVSLWTVNASGIIESTYLFGPYTGWGAVSIAVGPDNRTKILWRRNDETVALWSVSPEGVIESSPTFGPFLVGQAPQWFAIDVAVGPDNRTRLLWRPTDLNNKSVSLWSINPAGGVESTYLFGPYAGWEATTSNSISVGSDNRTRILWRRNDEAMALWSVNTAGVIENSPILGPFAGWRALFIGAGGPDNRTKILWLRNDEAISLWSVSPTGGVESTYLFGPY